LHFVEFLKFKHQSVSHLELEQKIQLGINQSERGLGVVLDDYVDDLNLKVQQRLAAGLKN
jgi:hypothetical protein